MGGLIEGTSLKPTVQNIPVMFQGFPGCPSIGPPWFRERRQALGRLCAWFDKFHSTWENSHLLPTSEEVENLVLKISQTGKTTRDWCLSASLRTNKGPPETSKISQHYYIEEFTGSPQLAPWKTPRSANLKVSNLETIVPVHWHIIPYNILT